jgi:SOS-response transcriptional repressor LexA
MAVTTGYFFPKLDIMSVAAKTDNRPVYGRVIAARRAFLGKSALDIENEYSPLLYQKLLYRIEGGKKHPLELDLNTFAALLSALEWTPQEFAEETGLKFPDTLSAFAGSTGTGSSNAESTTPQRRATDQGGGKSQPIRIPAFSQGSLAAGLKGYQLQETPDRYMAFSQSEVPKGVPADRLFMVQVGGDSMYDETMEKPIPEGAWLMVESRENAAPGQIVVAYLPDEDIAVVKQLRQDEATRNYRLHSYKVGGPTFWSQEHPDMKIQGVVRRVVYEF